VHTGGGNAIRAQFKQAHAAASILHNGGSIVSRRSLNLHLSTVAWFAMGLVFCSPPRSTNNWGE